MTEPRLQNPLPSLLVFTDLDGTLLDHDTYEFEQAMPALKLLQSLNIPLIPTTSKTVTELLQISQRLNNHHPFIAENGCIIGLPEGYFNNTVTNQALHPDSHVYAPYTLITLTPSYTEVLAVLQSLRREYGFKFQGFHDLSANEIAELTQLPLSKAQLAQQRLCSEPLVWLGDESGLQEFKTVLQQHNLQLLEGGRFWHVFGLTNKGLAMQQLIDVYQNHGATICTTIALGDSPNDIDMLKKADIAIVIKRKDGTRMDYCVDDGLNKRLLVSDKPGPAGWNDTLTTVLESLHANTVEGVRHV
ncbi:MAG: HAD-IIB family hydrolase [Gammaproteobacteria bacterium]